MSEPRAEYHFKPKKDRLQIEILGEVASRMMNGTNIQSPNIKFIVEGPLPPDLILAIMTVLSFHIGRQNPITRAHLHACLKDFKISDRHIRARINHLRRSGHLIGSVRGTAGHPERSADHEVNPECYFGTRDLESGGYYLITNADELQEFLHREYLPKIKDLQQTVASMTKTASQRWGPDSIQLKLL